MRCYFMLDGQVHNVEMLRDGPDAELIEGSLAAAMRPPSVNAGEGEE